MSYMTPEELRNRFAEAGHADVAEALIAGARLAVAIVREPRDDDAISVGASKLGGWPDVPKSFDWPRFKDRPLAFLGQFALGELPRAEGEPALPSGGLLSVFYDAAEQPWGFDPADHGGAVLLHWPQPAGLVRTKPPAGAYADEADYDEPFRPCAVRYEIVTTYPDAGDELYESPDAEALLALYDETIRAGQGEEDRPRHQFLGHPLVLQNPMEEECQLVSNGIYCGGEMSRADRKRAEALQEGVKDWTLLLRLDTDDAAGWTWGDVGVLYFWIRRQDLAARDFSKVWCVLQCG